MTFFAQRGKGPGRENDRTSDEHAAWDDTILPLILSVPTGAAATLVLNTDMGEGLGAGLGKLFFTGVAMWPGTTLGFLHSVNEPKKPMTTQLKTYAAGMAAGAFLVVRGCSMEAAPPVDQAFHGAVQSQEAVLVVANDQASQAEFRSHDALRSQIVVNDGANAVFLDHEM